ncbi:MAG: DUF998 domain-containing protein [Pseudolysinimonas sp.]
MRTSSTPALLTVTGSAVFVLAWLVLGAISPGYRLFDLVIDPYSPIAQPISGLGLGVTGPWMNAAFIICGALISAGAVLAARAAWGMGGLVRVGAVLIALSGVGMIIDGIFTLESVLLHLVGFLVAAPIPAVGLLLVGFGVRRSNRTLALVAIAGGLLSLTLFVVFMATFDPYGAGDNTGISGLLQRSLVIVYLTAVSFTVAALGRDSTRRQPAV